MHSGWYYEKTDLLNTPSIKDGLDVQMEKRFRREGARFIIDVGADLSLRYDTVASGCVYFHRFFMFHSFKEFNKHVTALGCLFLAGKVEETPKKCKDLLRVAKLRLTDEQYACFGEDPKEEIMVIERVLLQTIKFDLQVEHPYQFLIKYAKSLKVSKDKTGMESLVQMAWTFINDSLCTTICLEYEPEIVAIALMYLASRLGKFQINDWTGRKNSEQEKWWDQFVEDLTLELLEDICHQVLDLYSPTAVSAKPPIGAPSASGAKVSPPIVVQNIVVAQAKSNVSVMSMVRSAAPPPTLPPPIVQNPPPPLPPPAAAILPQVYAPSGSGPYACPVTFIPPPGGAAIPPRSAPPPAAPAPYGYPPPPHHPQYAYYPQPPQVPQMPTYATPQAYNVPPPNQQRPPPLMPPEYGGNMVQQQQRQIGTPPIVGGQQPPPPLLYPPQQQRSMMMRKPPPHGARY